MSLRHGNELVRDGEGQNSGVEVLHVAVDEPGEGGRQVGAGRRAAAPSRAAEMGANAAGRRRAKNQARAARGARR